MAASVRQLVTRDMIVEAISAWLGGTQSGWVAQALKNDEVDSAASSWCCLLRPRTTRHQVCASEPASAFLLHRVALADHGSAGICVLACRSGRGHHNFLCSIANFLCWLTAGCPFTLYSSVHGTDAHGESR